MTQKKTETGDQSSSPTSSTDRSVANPWVVPESMRKPSGWWCRWRRKIPGGATDRIVGAMANLGHRLSDQTVGNILRRHDIPPAPKRKQATTWKDFIRAHLAVLVATDFFAVEVLTLTGMITYYVLFFIHLESRKLPRQRKGSGRSAHFSNLATRLTLLLRQVLKSSSTGSQTPVCALR
jgi:hypothetical protein